MLQYDRWYLVQLLSVDTLARREIRAAIRVIEWNLDIILHQNLWVKLFRDLPIKRPVADIVKVSAGMSHVSAEGCLLRFFVPLPDDDAGVGSAHKTLTNSVNAVPNVLVGLICAEGHVGIPFGI